MKNANSFIESYDLVAAFNHAFNLLHKCARVFLYLVPEVFENPQNAATLLKVDQLVTLSQDDKDLKQNDFSQLDAEVTWLKPEFMIQAIGELFKVFFDLACATKALFD